MHNQKLISRNWRKAIFILSCEFMIISFQIIEFAENNNSNYQIIPRYNAEDIKCFVLTH